jgi:hypothetical protein
VNYEFKKGEINEYVTKNKSHRNCMCRADLNLGDMKVDDLNLNQMYNCRRLVPATICSNYRHIIIELV